MSRQAGRRRDNQAIEEHKQNKKAAQGDLRERQQAEGLEPRKPPALPNRKSDYETVEEEQQARQEATQAQLQVMRAMLPILLRRLKKIPDFRNPKKLRHKLTVLMIWGILLFVYQMTSRRQANRKMTRPIFLENLRLFFPELESCPHQDTLNRLLSGIDVDLIEETHVELIRQLIRKKKFYRFLIENCSYPIAFDGSQKIFRSVLLGEQWQERKVGKEGEKQTQYYVYVLEASLAFQNGMVIPLLSEFLDFTEGDTSTNKQDCELKAFYRLAERLKRLFPHFWWVNEIEYRFGTNQRKRQTVHVVICEESWEEIDKKTNEEVARTSRHVWLSSKPLNQRKVHERCNLGARHRWGIEGGFLVEKHHGYQYEHLFSHNWSAMRGYHYLMRIGHALNVLAQYSTALIKLVRTLGVRDLLDFVWETMAASLLDGEKVKEALAAPYQLRLA